MPSPTHQALMLSGGLRDQHFGNVVFQWEAEGTNGQFSGLTDVTGKTIVAGGGVANAAALSTTQARFGSTSLFCGIFAGGASVADSPDWDISSTASDPFTIEFSTYQGTLQTWECLYHWVSPSFSWWIRHEGGGQMRFLASSTGTSSFSMDVTTTGFGAVNNAWNDNCIEKDATGKFRFYRGGAMKYSTTPANGVFAAGTGDLRIDGHSTGYIDHIRITKGVARYASDSGYTFIEAPFPTS